MFFALLYSAHPVFSHELNNKLIKSVNNYRESPLILCLHRVGHSIFE